MNRVNCFVKLFFPAAVLIANCSWSMERNTDTTEEKISLAARPEGIAVDPIKNYEEISNLKTLPPLTDDINDCLDSVKND